MTNPPPPPASAMGLVAEWRETDRLLMAKGDPFNIGCSWTFGECAKDLAAALSLSEEEREAVKRVTYYLSNEAPLWQYMKTTDGGVPNNDSLTLRALIARVPGDKV